MYFQVEWWRHAAAIVMTVAFATMNVVGGYVVTDRMLEMFKSKKPAAAAEEGGAA